MPRKRTSVADTILDYFSAAPLPEARLTLQFAAAVVKRREPLVTPAKPKRKMARMGLKPAPAGAPAPQAAVPAPPPPPPGRRRSRAVAPADKVADPGPVDTVG